MPAGFARCLTADHEGEGTRESKSFMTSAQMSGTAAKRAGHATAQLTLATGSDDYFVFNDLQNGGWVIVGGDERQQDVLGYSAGGHFDARHLPVTSSGCSTALPSRHNICGRTLKRQSPALGVPRSVR